MARGRGGGGGGGGVQAAAAVDAASARPTSTLTTTTNTTTALDVPAATLQLFYDLTSVDEVRPGIILFLETSIEGIGAAAGV